MADVAAIANLGLVLDNGDLVSAAVFDNLGGHLNAGDKGGTDLDFRTVRFGDEEGVKGQRLARFELKLFNLELFALVDEVLLAASRNHCVHKLWAAEAPLAEGTRHCRVPNGVGSWSLLQAFR